MTGAGGELVIYSGRSENLVAPLIEEFEQETGINVEVRYGGTAEMAATILEEGDNSPADVFFAQDAGSLGALAQAGRLEKLPDEILNKVDARYRSPDGEWVGASGRARVLVYNTDQLQESDLPGERAWPDRPQMGQPGGLGADQRQLPVIRVGNAQAQRR